MEHSGWEPDHGPYNSLGPHLYNWEASWYSQVGHSYGSCEWAHSLPIKVRSTLCGKNSVDFRMRLPRFIRDLWLQLILLGSQGIRSWKLGRVRSAKVLLLKRLKYFDHFGFGQPRVACCNKRPSFKMLIHSIFKKSALRLFGSASIAFICTENMQVSRSQPKQKKNWT